MQVVVTVVCNKTSGSLRQAIVDDKNRLEKYGFRVVEQRRQTRPSGWSKLRSNNPEIRGVLNLEWDYDTGILVCRAITRGANIPSRIVGDFVHYLMDCFRRRVFAITILAERKGQ